SKGQAWFPRASGCGSTKPLERPTAKKAASLPFGYLFLTVVTPSSPPMNLGARSGDQGTSGLNVPAHSVWELHHGSSDSGLIRFCDLAVSASLGHVRKRRSQVLA